MIQGPYIISLFVFIHVFPSLHCIRTRILSKFLFIHPSELRKISSRSSLKLIESRISRVSNLNRASKLFIFSFTNCLFTLNYKINKVQEEERKSNTFDRAKTDVVVRTRDSLRFRKNISTSFVWRINGATSNIIFTVCRNRKVQAFNTPI